MIISNLVDGVPVEVSFLIGWNVLGKYALVIEIVKNGSECGAASCEILLTGKNGHTYLQWTEKQNVRYNYSVLRKPRAEFSASECR